MELNSIDVEDLLKVLYYVSLGISILLTLFYLFNFFDLVYDPYKKTSEAIIFLVGFMMMLLGMFLAYKYGYSVDFLWRAIGILVATCVISIIWIFVGLLFFNGPIHWQ
jgi:hypothetical protein